MERMIRAMQAVWSGKGWVGGGEEAGAWSSLSHAVVLGLVGLLAVVGVLVVELVVLIQTTVGFKDASGKTFGRVKGNGDKEEGVCRLLVLGDSVVAGTATGGTIEDDTITGYIARNLSATTGQDVEWSSIGRAGYTASKLLQRVDEFLDRTLPNLTGNPDVVVLSVGFNDAVRLFSSQSFKKAVLQLRERIHSRVGKDAKIVFLGRPPILSFPAIPHPLKLVIFWRCVRIFNILQSVAATTPNTYYADVLWKELEDPHKEGHWALDSFHPGPIILDHIATSVCRVLAH